MHAVVFLIACVALCADQPTEASPRLELYFIDVEGGQATLIVPPSREAVLVDAGYGAHGRDTDRTLEAMRTAHVTRIHTLVVTHFHLDHIGGIVDLARRVPIDRVYDHGGFEGDDLAVADEPETRAAFAEYRRWRDGVPHLQPQVGSRLRLGDVTLTWVSSDRRTIADPLPGAGQPNARCTDDAPEAEDPFENPRSTGFLLEYGRFRFLDVGDLTGAPLLSLVCPRNVIGPVDLYLLPHHGEEDGTYPAVLNAFTPRAVVVNNGARKGARRGALELLQTRSGSDVWQLHLATAPQVQNAETAHVANLDGSTGFGLQAIATRDGAFSMSNGRTGTVVRYPPTHGD